MHCHNLVDESLCRFYVPLHLKPQVQQKANKVLRDRATLDEALAELVTYGRVRLRNVGRQQWIDVHPELLGRKQ